jgi:acyl-CoA thioesterase FadM
MSYSTLLRWCEGSRELHWRRVIKTNSLEKPIDSVVVDVKATFRRPVMIGDKVIITSYVEVATRAGYTLVIRMTVNQSDCHAAVCHVKSAFVDPATLRPKRLPNSALAQLSDEGRKSPDE